MTSPRKLTRLERNELYETLIEAFPRREGLARVAQFHLGVNLDGITPGTNLYGDVSELIVWVEAQGRMVDLVAGALAENPANVRLRTFARSIGLAVGAAEGGDRGPPEPDLLISRLPVGTDQFVGRTPELATLTRAWEDVRTHVVTLVAWGGTGKSALVARWLADMARAGWRGATRVFGWSFYSQGARDDRSASAAPFFDAALTFFNDPDPTKGTAWERGVRLAKLLREQRALLVLDGLEPLQEPERAGGRLRDEGVKALLRELAAHAKGLCVVSTRQPVDELQGFIDRTVLRVDLDQLGEVDGANLLQKHGVQGKDTERREVARAVRSHALTLALLGNYIADALDGDIRRWREVPLSTVDVRPGAHARHVMEVYDRWFGKGPERAILRVLGLFDRPASTGCILALRKVPPIPSVTDALVDLSDEQWNLAVTRLRKAGLVAMAGAGDGGSLDAHPLVRECFGEVLARETPRSFRAAHGRLYEHLRDATPDLPDEPERRQPLYQAVWHGCKAGRHQEALDFFMARIVRDPTDYGANRTGDIARDFAAIQESLIASSEDEAGDSFVSGSEDDVIVQDDVWATMKSYRARWQKKINQLIQEGGGRSYVSSDIYTRKWLQTMRISGIALRALGRASEAPMILEQLVRVADSLGERETAISLLGHCSIAGVLVGRLKWAEDQARSAVHRANEAGFQRQRVVAYAELGLVLHTRGEFARARAAYQEAENVQRSISPDRPRLQNVQGPSFCHLLLDQGATGEVLERTEETFTWATEDGVELARSLNHLAFGRAHMQRRERGAALHHLDEGVKILSRIQRIELLPMGLLYRAETHRFFGDLRTAEADVAAARELSANMMSYMCDVYMHEGHLLLCQGRHEKARERIDRARGVVSDCGYHRRDADLALLGARLALAERDPATARVACERAREVISTQGLRSLDEELAQVEAALKE